MYSVTFDIRINSVTCPGVWLCTKGRVMLKISVLGTCKNSRRIFPRFPLFFYEVINIQKVLTEDIETIIELLHKEQIQIELIQWTDARSNIGIVLAKFNHRLCEILNFHIINKQLTTNSDVELLMQRTDYFPGIISPKIMASIRIILRKLERCSWCENSISTGVPIALSSKIEGGTEQIKRQRSVCHSRKPLKSCECCDMHSGLKHRIRPTSMSNCFSDNRNKNDDCSILEPDDYCKKFCHCCNRRYFCSWCPPIQTCGCPICKKYHQIFHLY